jgi:bifunctional non-homologous end joining protein LigD
VRGTADDEVEAHLPAPVAPMLAIPGDPPGGHGWAVEFKWDGVRALTGVAGERVRAHSRPGNDITTGYPELVALAELLDGRPALLDGELVTLDRAGRPDLRTVGQRMHLRHPPPDILARLPVSYLVLDVLSLDGVALMGEPYDRRREVLDGLGLDGPRVRVPPSTSDVPPVQLLDVARAHGLEGGVGNCWRVGAFSDI